MIKLTGYFNNILRDDNSSSSESVTISHLLSQAFDSYSHITRETNEAMRLQHRLRVVQSIEDTQMKNVIRSVQPFTSLSKEDLSSLYSVVKNEQLQKTNNSFYLDPTEKVDPTLPYYEIYKVDLDTFKTLFLNVSPWGAGPEMGVVLAERLFRLMDLNHDNLLSFKELVQIFDVICKGDHTRKLKLLYCLHLPGVVLPGELESPDSVDGAEVACDAEDFFAGADQAVEEATESLKQNIKISGILS